MFYQPHASPARFEITLTGDTTRFLERDNVDDGRAFSYLLGRLLSGFSVGEDVFASWSLEVSVKKQTDAPT